MKPTTPDHALGPTVHEQVWIGDQLFVVARPDAVDPLCDDPTLGSETASQVYQPYWASIWPAARLLAEMILREDFELSASVSPTRQQGNALEIGCGLGLAGLAALARGLHVTFSDYDATAFRYVRESARRNGFDQFDVLLLDWRSPPEGPRFPIVLAADLFFDSEQVEPVVRLISKLLADDGFCLLADRDRVQRSLIESQLARCGLAAEARAWHEVTGSEETGTLYRIRRSVSEP